MSKYDGVRIDELLEKMPGEPAAKVLRSSGIPLAVADRLTREAYGMSFEDKRAALRAEEARRKARVPLRAETHHIRSGHHLDRDENATEAFGSR